MMRPWRLLIPLLFPLFLTLPGMLPASTCGYSNLSPVPTARIDKAGIALNGMIYILGGETTAGSSRDIVEVYDPATDTWATRSPMPEPRNEMTAITFTGKIYVTSGNFGNTVISYDPALDTWTSLAPNPYPRQMPGEAELNGKIYVMGGQDLSASISYVNAAYDIATNSWAILAPVPHAKSFAVAGALNGKIYLVGGASTIVDVYDPVTDTWSVGPPLTYPRQAAGATVYNGRFYVAGGFTGSGFTSSVEVLDPALGYWASAPSLATWREFPTIAVVGCMFYTIGGLGPLGTGWPSGAVNSNEAYGVDSCACTPTITPSFSPTPPPITTPTPSQTPSFTPTFTPLPGATATITLTPGTSDQTGGLIDILGLYPNPFADKIWIGLRLRSTTELSLSIFNVSGEPVRTLPASTLAAGRGNLSWDGRNDSGRQCASGVYMMRLEAKAMDGDQQTEWFRAALLK